MAKAIAIAIAVDIEHVAGTPGPERPKTAQGPPRTLPVNPRDNENALEALWMRFGTILGAKWDQNRAKIVPKTLQSGVGQGLSCSLRFSCDLHNFFNENVADFVKFVGKAKIVSWGGTR